MLQDKPVMADKPMSENHRELLKKKYVPLTRDLHANHVIPYLYQEGVLTEEMKERLDAIPDEMRHKKSRLLLDLLPTRGDKAFEVFKTALDAFGFPFLAKLLDEPPPPELPKDAESAESVVTSEDVPDGPLKWLRLKLQPCKDSPSAKKMITGYEAMESGAKILIACEYKETDGVVKIVEGLMIQERLSPQSYNRLLYDTSHLNLNQERLSKLLTGQQDESPAYSSCLLLQAAPLFVDENRAARMRKIVEVVLKRGEEDPLHKYLHHVYCMLGGTILEMNYDDPSPALPACTSALTYKQDYALAVHLAAECSMVLSPQDAIQQFYRYLQLAPPRDKRVHWAHYFLAILYSRQSEPEKAEDHYKQAMEEEKKLLPTFSVGWAREKAQEVLPEVSNP
ncbi:CRADD [Branchiostoma lanceolatum]|uniref:CRADD protein n=1 Tax=Branchiostoma lanceolatum TaxID=7740 RepID=A0A8J9YY54_BRALA|nr:CRADD [Branchiostoma lanceolatum]